MEEHAPGPGEVLGDDGVEEPGSDPALDDDAAEAGGAGGLLVVVERVAVAGQLREELDVLAAHAPRAPSCRGSDLLHSPKPRGST